ncbi:MAG: hypothetical protein JXA36_04325 [Coriobacteriia bacterium]|nr:hypothetical protein [Coriobacteriia bacterium]
MRVHSVTVCSDRVDVVVQVDSATAMRTSADSSIAHRALQVLPGLARHRCFNDDGRTFAEELADTEVPHLFEHVVLELMAGSGSPRSLKGETFWDFKRDGRGVFRVSLEYDDDLVCLGAIKAADELVSYIVNGGEPPDIRARTDGLVALRGWPDTSAS